MQLWVQILVGLASLAIIVQTLAMVALFLRLRRLAQRMEEIAGEIQRHVNPILTRVHSLIEEAQPRITGMLSDAAEVTHIARMQVQRVDRVATEALDRLRMQLAHADQILTGVLETVESSGKKIRNTIWSPIQSIIAIVRGVQTGLEFYRGRRRTGDGTAESVAEPQPDETLFI